MNRSYNLIPLLLLAAGCAPTGAVGPGDLSSSTAKTPDGLTPSVETVCDEYSGGAFGLCNAYCEAMDCDHPDTRASDKACAKVAANFTKKTGDDLPCEAVACTVTAVDDEVTVDELDGFSVFPADNDLSTPKDATLTITKIDEVKGVGLSEDNEVSGIGPGYDITFGYTVCCDEDTCDSAKITVYGS